MVKISLIGNLLCDAVRVSKNGKDSSFISIKVAAEERKERLVFEVTLADGDVLQYLKSGRMVYIEGLPESKAYIDSDGNARCRMLVRAKRLDLLWREGERHRVDFGFKLED